MSLYDISTLGVVGNIITFNDFTAEPVFRVKAESPRNRQVREFDSPIPGESGIIDFETLIGQTDFLLVGTMYPGSEEGWRRGRNMLRKVANVDFAQNDPATDRGYVPYMFNEAGRQLQQFVKVLFVDMSKDTRLGFKQPFTLYCKIKHPVIHGVTPKVANTGDSPGEIIGAVAYPLIYPAVIGKTTYAVSAVGVNEGDIDAYPQSIIIRGPVNRPKFTNTTTGKYIEVDVNLATDSNELLIVYDQDSVSITLDGVSVYNKLSAGSELFKIPPGSNEFELTGSSIDEGAHAEISFLDAYPLS